MHRLPGGKGLLYFEEGRTRYVEAFGQSVSSSEQERKLMKQHGLTPAGRGVPAGVKANPKSEAMKRYLSKDQKGRWI